MSKINHDQSYNTLIKLLRKPKGQFRETGNIGYTRHRTKTNNPQKHKNDVGA